jgi:hypothetical protein
MRAAFAIVIGTLVLAPPAHADHTSVHATASGEMATTDNLFAAGSGGDRQADMFATIRPGILYAYDAPQMVHDFTAEAEVVQYLLHGDKPLLMGRAGWKSLFLPTPRLQLTMTINAATGLLSLMSAQSTADQTTATVMPTGKVDVENSDAAESLSWVSSQHTRVQQGVLGRYGFTDDGNGTQGETKEVGTNLGFERTFRKDTVGIDASVAYLKLLRIAPVGAEVGSRQDYQLNPRGTVSWRHDIDKQWSTSADGGVVYVNPVGHDKFNPGARRRSGNFGVAGAQLMYTELWGRALLSVRRDVAPNMFLAQNTVDDSANLQVAMPLPWLDDTKRNPKLAAAGSVGVDHTQLINSETGSTQGDFKVAHLDLSVGWTPKPGVTYGFRYELVYQTGDSVALMNLPSYYRNTVYFTFALRYPDRVVGELPKQRKGMRSDRKDLMPVGAEPVVIDVLDDANGDANGGRE